MKRPAAAMFAASTALVALAALLWMMWPAARARRATALTDGDLLTYTIRYPRDGMALAELARRTEARGLDGEALADYERVVLAEPDNAVAWAGVARLALKQGDMPKARIAALAVATIRSPGASGPLRDSAAVLTAIGDRNGARDLLEKAVAVDPDDAASWDALAVTQTARGALDDAARAARHAVSLSPREPRSWLHLTTARRLSADAPGARAALASARSLAPHDPDVLMEQGTLLAETGTTAADRAGAEAAFRAAAERLRGTDREAEALRRLGQFYLGVGRLPEARTALEHSLSQRPADTATLFALGRVMALTGKAGDATALMARFDRESEFDLEVRQLRLRMQREPQRADLPARLGDLFLAHHDPEKARGAWMRSLQIDSAQPALRRRLDSLP